MPRPLALDVMASTAGERNAVRDHILDAAHRVIVRDGLAKTSTRAIAEEATVANGTLYNYFADRNQLVAETMLRRVKVLSAPLHEFPSWAGSGIVSDNLRCIAVLWGDMLDRFVPLFAAASDGELLDAIRQTMASAHDSSGPFAINPIEAYLAAEQALGRVAADADCGAASSLVLSLCHERAFLHYFLGKAGGRSSIARQIDFIARSISSPSERTDASPDIGREGMMLADHKVATAMGATGIGLVLGYVVLGSIVPPALAILGAGLAAAAALIIALARRRDDNRPEGSSEGDR